MRKINGKAAVTAGQLRDRWHKKFRGLEVHLLKEEPRDRIHIGEMYQKLRQSGFKVSAVHSPMTIECSLESLHNGVHEQMNRVMLLADRLGRAQGNIVTVVIHLELSLEQLIAFNLIGGITNKIAGWLVLHDHVEIALENLSFTNMENGVLVNRSSYYDEPVKVAKYIRERLGTDRVGTVLDTCHMMGAIRCMAQFGVEISVERFVRTYADTLKLVHLSNAVKFGFLGHHGNDFETDEEIELFDDIVDILDIYVPDCSITIETNEVDMDNAVRMQSVRGLLEERNKEARAV